MDEVGVGEGWRVEAELRLIDADPAESGRSVRLVSFTKNSYQWGWMKAINEQIENNGHTTRT